MSPLWVALSVITVFFLSGVTAISTPKDNQVQCENHIKREPALQGKQEIGLRPQATAGSSSRAPLATPRSGGAHFPSQARHAAAFALNRRWWPGIVGDAGDRCCRLRAPRPGDFGPSSSSAIERREGSSCPAGGWRPGTPSAPLVLAGRAARSGAPCRTAGRPPASCGGPRRPPPGAGRRPPRAAARGPCSSESVRRQPSRSLSSRWQAATRRTASARSGAREASCR